MGASGELFLRMSEEEYLKVPANIRAMHLANKIYRKGDLDFDELIKDKEYNKLYNERKTITKQMEERKYYLREQKRKNTSNE